MPLYDMHEKYLISQKYCTPIIFDRFVYELTGFCACEFTVKPQNLRTRGKHCVLHFI